MLNSWFDGLNVMLLPPPMLDLFRLLDEELLIGDPPPVLENYIEWDNYIYVSGIYDDTIYIGTGEYSNEALWNIHEVV